MIDIFTIMIKLNSIEKYINIFKTSFNLPFYNNINGKEFYFINCKIKLQFSIKIKKHSLLCYN